MLWFWMVPIVMVPLIPKVSGLTVGGLTVLMDDLILAISCAFGLLTLFAVGAVRGLLPIRLSPVSVALACLIAYKSLTLLVFAYFLPWTDFDGIGKGVLFSEGILVLARLAMSWMVLILALQVFRTRSSVQSAVVALLGSASIVITLGLAQFFLLGHTILTSTFRPIAFIGQRFTEIENPWLDRFASGHEHLAAFCVLVAALVGGLLTASWKRRPFSFVPLTVLGCSSLFVLLFSSSRGGWIGGIAAFVVFMVTSFRSPRGAVRAFRLVAILLVLITVFTLATDIDIGDYVDRRVRGITEVISSGVIVDDSAKKRIATFYQLWRVFEQHPLAGLGPGGAGRIAEGQYIRELVEGGVIGASIFLLVVCRTARIGHTCLRQGQDRLTRGLGLGLLCSTAGLLAQALFTELFVVIKVITPFWLLVGLTERSWQLERTSVAVQTNSEGV